MLRHPENSQRYAYDSGDRLTAWIRGSFFDSETGFCSGPAALASTVDRFARRWTLDGVGNWESVKTTKEVSPGAVGEVTENRNANAFNEYSSIGSATQAHDDNGNLWAIASNIALKTSPSILS